MKKWITKNGLQISQILSGRSNSFLVSKGHKHFLIDTGTKHSWEKLSRRLDDLNIKQGSLIALILTHVHYDHAENSAKIKNKYNTNIIVHESESKLLLTGENATANGTFPINRFLFKLFNGEKLLQMKRFEPSQYDITVKHNFDLKIFGFDAFIIHTPGHSIGSMSVIIDNEIAIVGDSMFGVFKGSVLPPWAQDVPLMIKSWKNLLDTGCSLFLPAHGTGNSRELLQKQYEKHQSKLKHQN
jgi:hydroxyacylglutathione hydrolase